MSQQRFNRIVYVLGWLGRIWNAILLAFCVCMVLFLLYLSMRAPQFLGTILFGMGLFMVIGLMCFNDLRRHPDQ